MTVWYRLLIILVVVSSEKRNFQLIFDVVTIKHWAPDLIDEINSTLVQLNNRSYVNGYFILKKNVDKLEVNSTMDFWNVNNKKRRLYSFQMDACRFMIMLHKNRLLSIFAKSFQKHSNGVLKCPFKAHFNYSLQNWYLDEQDFPNYIPEGRWQTVTEYLIRKNKILRIVVRGRVIY